MQVKPFKAFRFDAAVVGDAGSCIAPPYDVINDAQQEQLYEKSRHNIVRIIKGKTSASDNGESNQYTRAAEYLNDWISQGVLKRDSAEAIYGYVQDFELGGVQFQRLSFIALAKLEEFGEVVKPHEQILNGPMIDRLNLQRATAAGFGLIFMLYDDEQKIADEIMTSAMTAEPLIDFVDEQDVRHRLFAITVGEQIEPIVAMMSNRSCIIADGHHRYTTGLAYSKESSNPNAGYQMIAFSNTRQDGLVVLPTHRLAYNLENFSFDTLIADLGKNFQVTDFPVNSTQNKTEAKQKMLAKMRTEYQNGRNAFGIYGPNGEFYVAVLKDIHAMDSVAANMSSAWRALDVSVLHKLILDELLGIDEGKLAAGENLQYVKDTPDAIDDSIAQVDSGRKQVAFFMNPVTISQMQMVTDAGERMPQKSTYFYPKVYTGLTINKF
ncbi:MAG: DUF1015 domain-containing protein [Planctomycetota bacterium]